MLFRLVNVDVGGIVGGMTCWNRKTADANIRLRETMNQLRDGQTQGRLGRT